LFLVSAAKVSGNQGLFNNAAQVWNHSFYWNCMKANGGGAPTGRVAELIDQQFGSYQAFRQLFEDAANTAFGSGWAWLVHTPAGLKVTKTTGADTPLVEEGSTPILTCDVWEHAYYLDYQNLRPSYVTHFLDHLVNWDFVNSQIPN
jgi:superoxide dismutase, Fe-Mn family